MLRRAENSGSPALVLTVDLPNGAQQRNTLERYKRLDKRDCNICHTNSGVAAGPKPMLMQIPQQLLNQRVPLDWKFVDRLRKETSMKILIKGIVTAEDAERCVSEGIDGVIVSNHGGRADNSGRGAIDSLAEVTSAIKGKTLILMDSGIRRGSDIFKALALGADAICIGRPYLWGLGSFGQSGVERVLELLQEELKATMQFSGVNSIHKITNKTIGTI
jgi:isopentenyl diphosphate isomerase/L-lactate dehydrogenase-like FMN-dependent dehydrogenase